MVQLADVRKQAKELSEEDRKSLVAYLLHGFTDAPLGSDDDEVARRDARMDSGAVSPISHAEFLVATISNLRRTFVLAPSGGCACTLSTLV